MNLYILGFDDDGFDSNHGSPNPCQILDRFMDTIPEKPSMKVKFKVLVTCHIIIGDQNKGEEFSEIFVKWKGWKLNEGVGDHRFLKQYYTFL